MPARLNRTGAKLREWETAKAVRTLRREELVAEMRARFDFSLLRPVEVAALLGCTTKKIRALDASGGFIPKVMIGSNSPRYRQSDLIEWMKGKTALKAAE